MDDPHDLKRFVRAQDAVYGQVLAELTAGRKQSHWMWFVFPQLAGLGHSATARSFALGTLEEARAYLAHPVLGVRLRECTQRVNELEGLSAGEIFGYPDELKFRSSMTLFARADAPGGPRSPFREALAKYFAGEEDPLTRKILTSAS